MNFELKLLIISDTHRRIDNAADLIRRIKPDYVLHLGDVCEDCVNLQKMFQNQVIISVMGNNDYPERYPDIPYERVFTLGKKKFFMCHGHKYGVKFGLERLALRAEELGADIALYGHTHFKYLDISDEMIILNPGSVRSYGIIEINGENVKARLENYEQR